MPRTEPRTLDAMHNGLTCYEAVIETPRETIRMGFFAKRTKATLYDAALDYAHIFRQHLAGDEPMTYSREMGFETGAVRIRFSGQTERSVRTRMNRGEA